MSTPNNIPAFPSHCSMGGREHPGMSLRDYFAGQALMGLLASGHFTLKEDPDEESPWMTRRPRIDDDGKPDGVEFCFPEAAWRCADQMIAAREQGKEAP